MRIVLRASLALLLLGCADPLVLPGSGSGEFELGIGDRAIFSAQGVEVRFVRVPDDSRCPVDVTCPWQGDAEVMLALTGPGLDTTVALHTSLDPTTTQAGPIRLSIVSLSPVPRSDTPTDPDRYRVRLRAEDD